MKKWKIQSEFKIQPSFRVQAEENSNFKIEKLIKVLLENRGIKTKGEIDEFLNPKIENVSIESVGIDKKQINKAVNRIEKAVKNKEKIVVYGDYDVDGICGSAILWETLNELGADVMPYIPHRIDEGYGLSEKGIKNLKLKIKNCSLVITVDNGIVATKAVDFANSEGIDVIITDHHVSSGSLPDALAFLHTTRLCGTGVAWLLSQQLRTKNSEFKNKEEENHLELVALATIADLVPLIGPNRILVKFGIEKLRLTKRIGLLELFKEAGINQSEIGVYEIGHMIAPRLNAMGRMEYAMDSLRLLCTNNRERARDLAQVLGKTNRDRQTLTIETAEHAKLEVKNNKMDSEKLMFVVDESYQQGVIGLVAGKLVEEFYRPAIVISKGEEFSKASARSISGFNIIEFLRSASDIMVDVGGHPMAAGFTVETSKITLLHKTLKKNAVDLIDEDSLKRVVKVDCEIPLTVINYDLYREIQKFSPFGMGNPEPVFLSRNVEIKEMRTVGYDGKHIKLKFSIFKFQFSIDGIGFGLGEMINDFKIGDNVDIVYSVDENIWNGNRSLQLKVKDIKFD